MYVSQFVSPQSSEERLATVLALEEFPLQLRRGQIRNEFRVKWYYLYKTQ